MSTIVWDVVIVGAGPAGCATALALAQRGVEKVCVIDASPEPGSQIGETLPPETRLVLEDLGLWEGFLQQGHEPSLGSCSTWGSDAVGYNDFLLDRQGLGWHLDRVAFNRLLRRQATARGITVLEGTTLVRAEEAEGGPFDLWVQSSVGPSTLTARYVVDASGARSVFGRMLGARPQRVDRLSAIYGFFDASHAVSSSRLTLLEAVDEGWWYCAPLPGSRVAVAFATDPEFVRAEGLTSEDRWFARVLRTRHIAPRLDGCRLERGSLTVRIAPSFQLVPPAGSRWLAVGDAAATYDPLSSQGIHKALADGVAAASSLVEVASGNGEIASSYAEGVRADFNVYRETRDHFYALERRWEEAPFWRRRRQQSEPIAHAALEPVCG